MKKQKLIITISLGLFITGLGLLTHSTITSAQANTGGQALEIAPPVLILTADPGETIKTKINLRNISSGDLLVKGIINDFVAGGEDGTPKIMLEEDESSPFSIKEWVSVMSDLLLVPRQIEDLDITINVPKNAAPGGYYGVVRFTAVPPELDGTGVSLSASLGSLILLKVNGVAEEKLSIEEFSVSTIGGDAGTLFESTPIQFNERLKNEGNIHEQPVGKIIITDMFGKVVTGVNVNLSGANVLPNSIRKFDQPLDSSGIGNKVLFGYYTAELEVTYGVDKQVVKKSISFWIIPYRLIAAGIIALIVGFIVLRIAIRRYNRHIISRVQKTQKTHKK